VTFYVYLLASRRHGTLYLGITSDLPGRIHQHKTKATLGFTSKYGVDRLVWFETHDDPTAAIAREKALKKWRRAEPGMARSVADDHRLTRPSVIPGPA
jgi:putative endonuclease